MEGRGAALAELLSRYATIFRHAWSERKQMDPSRRIAHEAAFLPAALALQETPVHPAPRIAMGLILLFAGLAVAWAVLGHVDVVASAAGKIVLDERSKIVQPLETGTVRWIGVRDGQTVRAGEPLIELDPTVARADIERLTKDLYAARLEAWRNRALLQALDEDRLPAAQDLDADFDAAGAEQELRIVFGRHSAFRAMVEQLEAEIARRDAERRAVEAEIEKLRLTLPIVRQREADYRDLRKRHFVSNHGLLELEQARIEQERELVVRRERLAQIVASRTEAERQRLRTVAEARREWLDREREAGERAQALAQELIKAESRGRMLRLEAPVDGVVQQLAVHTLGAVVTAAQPLLVLVPQDHPLEVEALVLNKDVGFVHAGQPVEVKVETFAFTKYGTIPGEIVHVSSDAIQDDALGLVFAARVRIARDALLVEGRPVRLSPGMAVTVEIKTGARRVIEYFLGPLLQYADETLRER